MNLWCRCEQGEEAGSLGSLAFCWCRRLAAQVCGVWRRHPFPSGDSSFLQCRVGSQQRFQSGKFPRQASSSPCHSWKLSQEPLLQFSPELPELPSIILICSFFPAYSSRVSFYCSELRTLVDKSAPYILEYVPNPLLSPRLFVIWGCTFTVATPSHLVLPPCLNPMLLAAREPYCRDNPPLCSLIPRTSSLS